MEKTVTPLERYQCGPLRFTDHDLYDRRLVFDHVVPQEQASSRERFEALACSVRDLLAQRWLLTQRTHDQNSVLQRPDDRGVRARHLVGETVSRGMKSLQLPRTGSISSGRLILPNLSCGDPKWRSIPWRVKPRRPAC
jgi:hypothetical protein